VKVKSPYAVYAGVERHYPGMRVIAGPFAAEQSGERAMAVRALQDQMKAGHECKLVTHGAKAFVLRTVAGWMDMEHTRQVHMRSTRDLGSGRLTPKQLARAKKEGRAEA